MSDSVRTRRWLAVVLVGAFYAAVGILFAVWGNGPNGIMWRRMAWVVSALAYGLHIAYELFGLSSPATATAKYVALAAALGSFGLAAGANLHPHDPSINRRLVLSLVVWPVITALPAFVVALLVAVVLQRATAGRSPETPRSS